MKAQRLSCSVLLPMIAIVVWAVLVPTPALVTCLQLITASHGADPVHVYFGDMSAVVPRSRLFIFCLEPIACHAGGMISGTNIPGMLASVLISLPLTWPALWSPPAFSFESRRAIAYPFYCFPWWWFAGRSLDCLAGRRKVGWVFLSVGSLLCLLCIFLDAGLFFGLTPRERTGNNWIYFGFTLWAILFGITPLAWWRQRQRLRNAPVEAEKPLPANTNGAAEAAPSDLLNHEKTKPG
ncbi:MAG: hypothetical protein ACP5M4_05310 [Acidobacteriaceae bacterium]